MNGHIDIQIDIQINMTNEHPNVYSIPEEVSPDTSAVNATEETTVVAKKKLDHQKKVALFLIFYGLAIFILSLNISSNVLLASIDNSDLRNKSENQKLVSRNHTTCHVSETSKLVTLTCKSNTRHKTFYLGNQFNFTSCENS